jgi:hypothetical protein
MPRSLGGMLTTRSCGLLPNDNPLTDFGASVHCGHPYYIGSAFISFAQTPLKLSGQASGAWHFS